MGERKSCFLEAKVVVLLRKGHEAAEGWGRIAGNDGNEAAEGRKRPALTHWPRLQARRKGQKQERG